jgi:uncharacterized protein (TIGR02391 family)
MRWDDIELLGLVDRCEAEEEFGPLMTGYSLMEAAREGRPFDPALDPRALARELLLARQGGYLEWNEFVRHGARRPHPIDEPQQWLQEIRDLRVTLAGRDRARGRVVLRPLPDPEEDDGRLITGMCLEEIARAIGETYTGAQLPRYLADSGIPAGFVPEEVAGSKASYVLGVLESLHDSGSAARRSLREFIGGWFEGAHHVPPDAEVGERITARLAAQGWHVRDGRLVVGDAVRHPVGARGSEGSGWTGRLHPAIGDVAVPYLESGHAAVAVFESFKLINHRVREMTGLDLDGSKLMGEAFSDSEPPIRLADLSSLTGRDIQAGFRFLFMGAARGIRNPDAHELFEALDDEEARETLAFASLLMRRLDDAERADRED